MSVRKEHLAVAVVIILALVSLSGPFLYAWENSGEDTVFGGFLFNPIDGNSYLAKMYQGWRGDTQFTLPYTAEPGPLIIGMTPADYTNSQDPNRPIDIHKAALGRPALIGSSLTIFLVVSSEIALTSGPRRAAPDSFPAVYM